MAPDRIALYLEEDLGERGDVTTDPLLGPEVGGAARVVARERCFVAGLVPAAEVFARLGVQARPVARDGAWCGPGDVLLEVEGPARGILSAERTALNLLGRMCGVATNTRRVVEALEGTGCRAAATRKTTPGFRFYEKEAVRLAGGDPHRMGLFDEAMVKDNHRAAAGDLAAAVRRIRRAHPEVVITAEAEGLEEALAAAAAGAQWVLLDNQPPETGRAWAERLRKAHPDVRVEASGGIAPERVRAYAWADRVSLGCLTRDVRVPDLSLEWGP